MLICTLSRNSPPQPLYCDVVRLLVAKFFYVAEATTHMDSDTVSSSHAFSDLPR
jgi:hypothetical protein